MEYRFLLFPNGSCESKNCRLEIPSISDREVRVYENTLWIACMDKTRLGKHEPQPCESSFNHCHYLFLGVLLSLFLSSEIESPPFVASFLVFFLAIPLHFEHSQPFRTNSLMIGMSHLERVRAQVDVSAQLPKSRLLLQLQRCVYCFFYRIPHTHFKLQVVSTGGTVEIFSIQQAKDFFRLHTTPATVSPC